MAIFRFGITFFLLLSSQILPAKTFNDPPVNPQEGTAGASLPLELFGGRPVVQISIGGHGPYKVIFDTGSDQIVLDQSIEDALHLDVVGEMDVSGPMGPSGEKSKVVKMPDLEIGGAHLSNVEAAVSDFSQMFHGKTDAPQGVLGASFLHGYLVTLDYPHSQFRIRRGSLPSADNLSILEWEMLDGLPALKLDLAGIVTRVHLDTGSPAGIMLPHELASKLSLASAPEKIGKARLVGGEADVYRAKLNGAVKLGNIVIEGPDLEFWDGVPYGNIGHRFLQDYSMTLDAENHRVQFSRN
jgi:hypothetical protein